MDRALYVDIYAHTRHEVLFPQCATKNKGSSHLILPHSQFCPPTFSYAIKYQQAHYPLRTLPLGFFDQIQRQRDLKESLNI